MKLPRIPTSTVAALLLALSAALVFGGCASSPRLHEARTFAAESAKLGGFADLTERFRDTYQRAQPYLSGAADQREREADLRRRAAYPDLMAIHAAVLLYMQTLGKLAGGEAFDLKEPIQAMGAGIKAWPDTGLTDRHVNAYSGMARLLARSVTTPYQERAVQALVRDGGPQLQVLLEAMQNLLRYYDKSSDNERDIVLGMLEVEIAYADTPRDRLLAALAKSHRLVKRNEYRLIGLRHTLAGKHVAAIAVAHAALLQRMTQADGADGAPAQTAQTARAALRANAAIPPAEPATATATATATE